VGAGGGELLGALAVEAPARWSLVGVDLAGRPDGLARRVAWRADVPARVTGLVVANEWLDNVPVDVVELTPHGPRLVEVSDDGEERAAGPPAPEDSAWLDAWWPLAEAGDRAEVGRPRDEAWASVLGAVERGVAVAVDYAVDPPVHPAGTLTGYRDGRQVAPVPDGGCDITAHVHLAACAAAGRAAGASDTLLTTQREALRELGVRGDRPAYTGDPVGYLAALSRAGEAAELTDPGGLGGFGWLVQTKRIALPLRVASRPAATGGA
jgi:SAM-dependent MidA family methyltransferase